MTIYKDLVVVTGTYTTRDGQEKKRYLNIGQIHEGKHGQYITLESHINLAALPRRDGDTRVMVSLYDPKPRGGQQGAPQARQTEPAPPEFDDDIPF